MTANPMPWSGARIVPMVVLEEAKSAPQVMDALMAGGLKVIEIALRTPQAIGAIQAAVKHGGMTVAAGTVTRADQVRQSIDAGASFGLSPSGSDNVLETVTKLNWPFIPSIATVTEANRLLDRGFVHQKLFPADLLGAEKFARALFSVLPDIRLLPSGGVSEANVASYLEQANVFAVTGSWIAPRELISNREYAEITRRARAATEISGQYD